MSKRITTLVLIFLFTTTSWAQVQSDKEKVKEIDLNSLSYPELDVTPHASDVLQSEAKKENRDKWKHMRALQVSAVGTLLAGSMIKKKAGLTLDEEESFNNSKNLAMFVGAGWLATSYVLATQYKPYRTGYYENKKMSSKDKRAKLSKERHAEKVIHEAASLGWKIKWMSLASNLAASAMASEKASKETEYYGSIGMLLAFSPILFDFHWEDVCRTHDKNKKKVYGPVASSGLVISPNGKSIMPGLQLTMSF